MDAAKRTGPALEAMYRFVLWLVPVLEQFPRRQQFLLGDARTGNGWERYGHWRRVCCCCC